MRIFLPLAFILAALLAWIYLKWIRKDPNQAKVVLQWSILFTILWAVLYALLLS